MLCKRTGTLNIASSLILASVSSTRAAMVWSSGPNDITFSKAPNADPTLASNQDRITSLDWLTRGSTMGLYNAEQETGYSSANPPVSPLDTEWAFSGLDDDPTFSYGQGVAEYSSLTFADWEDSLNGAAGNYIVDRPAVVHLITDDTYIDIEFTAWGESTSGGGSFTYERAVAPVPEPASLGLLGIGTMGLLGRRRKA